MSNGRRLAGPLHRTYLRSFSAPPTACGGLVTARTIARVMYHDSAYVSSPPDRHSLFMRGIRLTLSSFHIDGVIAQGLPNMAHHMLNVPVGSMRPVDLFVKVRLGCLPQRLHCLHYLPR